MTLSSTTARASYTANGAQTVFAYPFRIDDALHLQLYLDDELQASGFALSGVGSDGGGNVTFTSAPASGTDVTVIRAVPLTQPTDLPTQGPLDTAAIEKRFDQIVMQVQALRELIDRSLVLPPSSGALGLELPALVASRFLAANAGATGLEWAALVDSDIVSAPMQPVVGAASLLLARSALGMGAIEALVSGGPDGRMNPVWNADCAVDDNMDGAAIAVSGGETNKLAGPAGWKGTFAGAGVCDVSRAAVAIGTVAGMVPSHAVKADVTTADASLAATDRYTLVFPIEGRDMAWCKLGSASAQTFTLSFFLSSPLTGTFEVALQNSAADRSYIGQVTVAAADTWQRVSFTVAGDQSGTWLSDAGTGLRLLFNLGAGSTFHTAAGAWAAGNFLGTASGQNRMASTAYDTFITGVQIDAGSQMLPFRKEAYQINHRRTQRYLRIIGGPMFAVTSPFIITGGDTYATTNMDSVVLFDQLMRGTPNVTIADATRFSLRGGTSGNRDATAVSAMARAGFLYADWTTTSLVASSSGNVFLDDSAGTGKIVIDATNS